MISVFTATYNRANYLPRLYESLVNQTNKEFEWIVVDDGSTDNTKEIVDGWMKENKIKIKYYYQENAGKMQAHNTGVINCNNELFLNVDSDDYLVGTAIEKLYSYWNKHEDKTQITGLVTYNGKSETEKLNDSKFPNAEKMTLTNLYKNGASGDACCVYKTELLKKYLFPKIEGEKFVTENYVYSQIDNHGELILVPEIIKICEYLEDGYSKNIYSVFNKNPKGMALYYNLKVKQSKSLIDKIKFSAGYICYSKVAKNKKAFKESNNKFIYIISFPIGLLLYLKRKKY